MTQDAYQKARENWDDAVEASGEQRRRMIDDLKFSNPTDPEQWDDAVSKVRRNDPGGPRPTYVFDQTNQYISQVVNDSRQNKPQIQTVPASSGANEKVSEALDGMIRQIEYASSASMAYDTAQEQAARIGLGWFRILPVAVETESEANYNAQEIRILRVPDPLAVQYDPSFESPDGSDQTFGFVETTMPKAQYLRQWPKRKDKASNWKSDSGAGWYGEEQVRICEYFEQVETRTNLIVVSDLGDTEGRKRYSMPEADYWDAAQKTGVKLPYHGTRTGKTKKVMWSKMDGDDFLDEPALFQSKWIPLIPVMGYELWIEGKRYLCGMVRRMRPGQQAYNMERNAELEWMASQPKAPYLVPWEAVSEHQKEWAQANTSNQAYLPYDHVDANGMPLPPPARLAPPNPGAAFQNLGMKGIADVQASIGMYRANLGAPSNETSGIAIKRREQQGDTANFHYIDNLARSMTHAGRIIVDMIPRLYDEEREARILGLDGKSQPVVINPKMTEPVRMNGKKVAEINLTTGIYDVRCKVGPAYASLREETADALTKIVQQSPQLMTVLGPMWARMQDWPEAEHLSKILLALAPPPVQALENENEEMPPAALAQIAQLKQQLQQLQEQGKQLGEALENAAKEHEAAEQKLAARDGELNIKGGELQIKGTESQVAMFDAQTRRMVAMRDDQAAEPSLILEKAQIDAAARIAVARINAEATQELKMLELAVQPAEGEPEFTGYGVDDDAPKAEQPNDSQAMMAEALALLAQTLAQTQARPPMRIEHERDANGLLLASMEVPA